MTTTAAAYAAGLVDGQDWDLTDVDPIPATGWDDATINAMGGHACRLAWGVADDESGDATWGNACREYNRGVVDAIRARGVEVQS
jgi:hypothetical protein